MTIKVGYLCWEYEDFVEFEGDDLDDAVEQFADDNHEIVEDCDINFELMAIDDDGKIFQINMITEFDPHYVIEKKKQVES